MRRTGRTTKQIINTPKNSIYLCLSEPEAKKYCREIAIPNNRQDLTFISYKNCHQERLRGRKQYVILDHAIEIGLDMPFQQYDFIQIHNNILKAKENQND